MKELRRDISKGYGFGELNRRRLNLLTRNYCNYREHGTPKELDARIARGLYCTQNRLLLFHRITRGASCSSTWRARVGLYCSCCVKRTIMEITLRLFNDAAVTKAY